MWMFRSDGRDVMELVERLQSDRDRLVRRPFLINPLERNKLGGVIVMMHQRMYGMQRGEEDEGTKESATVIVIHRPRPY